MRWLQHRSSVSSCLLDGPGIGGNSVVQFDCSLDGRVWVKGGVKGISEEGPVCVFIIL